MDEISPNPTRYRIRGEGEPVVIVKPGYLYPQLDEVDLAEGWVWLSPQDGTFQAARRDWLVPVLTDHDMRTVSGGVTLRHGVMKDWVEQDQRWDIPVVEISMRGGTLALRRADVTEIRHVLGKMQAEMPPDPLMPG